MNTSFDPLHLVNSYGAFGSVTKERHEIVLEGSANPSAPDEGWREYEFKGKPGDPRRRPRQVAPYHLRLDWLMWFAAMQSPLQHPWFLRLSNPRGKSSRNGRPRLHVLPCRPHQDPSSGPGTIRGGTVCPGNTSCC